MNFYRVFERIGFFKEHLSVFANVCANVKKYYIALIHSPQVPEKIFNKLLLAVCVEIGRAAVFQVSKNPQGQRTELPLHYVLPGDHANPFLKWNKPVPNPFDFSYVPLIALP